MISHITLGKEKIETAAREMAGIRQLVENYASDSPLQSKSLLVCVTPTPQTGVLLMALRDLGAVVAACADNQYASDDDVVSFLKSDGIAIFAKSNMSSEEYHSAMDNAIDALTGQNNIQIIDDGCDITRHIIKNRPEVMERVRIISEQTTCGINHLKTLHKRSRLAVPAININHSFTKQWFDNYIGIQQSIVHALTQCGITIAGKNITVCGYGPVGKGAANALRSLGARVSIVEQDIIYLMQAELEGFIPTSLADALASSDICITATGCINTISGALIQAHAKDGIILANIGHGNEEYDVLFLKKTAKQRRLNQFTDEFTLDDGRHVYSLCDGALLNFIAGGGTPSTLRALTFTLPLLTQITAASDALGSLDTGIHCVFEGLEKMSVELCFPHLVERVTPIDDIQRAYLHE